MCQENRKEDEERVIFNYPFKRNRPIRGCGKTMQ